MNTRIQHVWEKLASSYWFVPALMMSAAAGLASLALHLDRSVFVAKSPSDWFYDGDIEGARTLLSTVAGSIVTVAGVVFSITIAALTQASAQFGPRLLRNFMRDGANQLVLGTFVATFLYCILVLRAVPEGEATAVPHFSVTVAVGLSIASLCVLVFFIHHISASMQAPHVVARAAMELRQAIERRYPARLDSETPAPPPTGPMPPPWQAFGPDPGTIRGTSSGYLQAVDEEEVMRIATDRDLRLELLQRPGKFLLEGSPLVLVWPARAVSAALCRAVNAAFLVGRQRTPEQDIEYALDQMVEIAVRALSPGVNDPFTAVTCIDWLGDSLRRLSACGEPPAIRPDRHGASRVVAHVPTFPGLVDAAFDQIRQYGRTSVPVTIRLLESIAALAEHVDPEQRAVLLRKAAIIHRESHVLPAEEDRRDVDGRFRAAVTALERG
ncbi:MAG: DUF2254 domain-containing protein [Myxococcota bacterium]